MDDNLPPNFAILESRVQELYDVLPKLNLGTKNQKFTCTKCNQLMIRAYKANSCQHRFCGQCIRLLQRNEKCPRDGQFMSTQKIVHAKAEKDLEKEIAQVKVKCPYGCDNIITILDILTHLQECSYKEIAKHGNTGDTPSFAQWAQADDKDNLSKTVEAMKKQLTQMSASQHNFQKNTELSLQQLLKNINDLHEIMNKSEKDLTDIKTDLLYMSELQKSSLTLPPSNCFSLPTGELSWKIMNYRSAKNQAISHNSKIRSDIFATDQGYKFCLEVLLNGYSDNYKGYVSMVLKLLPGENDNALCWPFTGHVTISLMALGQPLFEKCVPVDMNQSIGKKRSIVCIPQFVTINKLETDCKCLANDFLEIKVSVKQN